MICAMMKASFDRLAATFSPAEALDAVRAGLVHLEADRFVTAVVASFDPAAGTLVYASAGHGPALLVRRGDAVPLPRTGPLLSSALPARPRDSEWMRLHSRRSWTSAKGA